MNFKNRFQPNSPYVFISYSSADSYQVFSDVSRLADEGLNLWIDVELDYHVGESWKDRVHKTLKSANCKGILFFISKNSLTSSAVCNDELRYSKSGDVLSTHFGKPLPLLPVEVTKIDNITNFCYELSAEFSTLDESINSNADEFARTVETIRENFFDTNDIKRFRIFDNENITPLINRLLEIDKNLLCFPPRHNLEVADADFLEKKARSLLENTQDRQLIQVGLEYLTNAAMQGSASAYLKLGNLYAKKNTIVADSPNLKKAESCFTRAKDLGNITAVFNLALLERGRRNYKKTIQLLSEVGELTNDRRLLEFSLGILNQIYDLQIASDAERTKKIITQIKDKLDRSF